jgi:hypothetical protein
MEMTIRRHHPQALARVLVLQSQNGSGRRDFLGIKPSNQTFFPSVNPDASQHPKRKVS